MKSCDRRLLSALLLSFLSSSEAAPIAATPSRQDSAGEVQVLPFSMPFSTLASPEARKSFAAELATKAAARKSAPAAIPQDDEALKQTILTWRKKADEVRRKIAADMERVFPVTITSQVIGDVRTEVVIPREGVAAENKNRVLINLHGGGMIFGARYEGEILSIPIASLGKIKVITIDYRMAPEYRFPAASEDVAAVYAGLLKTIPPANIGIYGCSAGGALTVQALAWFQSHHLPRPGAAGVLCAGTLYASGDSYYVSPVLTGESAPTVPEERDDSTRGRALNLYTSQADPHDPHVDPLSSKAVFAKFPPVLFINSTRDPSMSSALHAQVRLTLAGVEAPIYLWDGLTHAFMYDANLPESREVYEILIQFFASHLGSVNKES